MSENQNETPTIDEAVEETRDLIDRMATSIKSVKGSQAAINAQDIPNEIRSILGVSPVTKTYYDVRSYLSDIGTLLKQGGSTPINAQDFPDVIETIDTRYTAPNGQKYYYKYTYYGVYFYQGFTADFDVYTNIKIGCLSTDRKAYALYNGTKVLLAIMSAPSGTYTDGDRGAASNDYVHYNQSGYVNYYIEQCYYSRSGQNGNQLIMVKNPDDPTYPGSFNSTFPIFSTEQALLDYLNS